MPLLGKVQKQKAPANWPEPLYWHDFARLLELGRDALELGVQRGAEAVHDRDDRDRNSSSNQAVLDRRGARVVLNETNEEVFHR